MFCRELNGYLADRCPGSLIRRMADVIFVVLVLGVIALVHVYVYQRTVRAITTSPRARRVGSALVTLLGTGGRGRVSHPARSAD